MDLIGRQDELDAFFHKMDSLGAQAFDFECAYSPELIGEEEIVELTYLPTGETRWYDVAKRNWASAAVEDFRVGRFAKA